MLPTTKPRTLLLWIFIAAAATVQAGRPRVCRVVAGEDCSSIWADFRAPDAADAVVILTFEGDGYYAGAQATIASAIGKAKGPLLFGVASNSHAAAITEWFAGLAAASEHALCSVDPQTLPDVWKRAQELAGYSKPQHHSNWGAAAPSALYRVFLRQLFPHAVRALYVDADVILQTAPAVVVSEVSKPMALPLTAARSANMLKTRMDYCCQASKKVRKLLGDNSSGLDASETELLQDFQELAASYREFNNGVMALDLVKLDEAGVFKRLQTWLQLNLKHELFNNDQHAWNLAATLHWQDLQESYATNAPSLELMEASLLDAKPLEHYQAVLRKLAFVHYTNQPKPWQVDWSKVPRGALFDDAIWLEAFKASGGAQPEGDRLALTQRQVASQQLIMLRPAVTPGEDFEYGMMYMEGSGGLAADTEEARWRLTRAAEGGDPQAKFMIAEGLDAELKLPDKVKLAKLERCWALAGQRIESNEDHQTLRTLYKMSELEYLAKKAPVMVGSCYWRLQSDDLKSRRLSPEELEALFGPSKDGSGPPGLTPRLGKWLELIAKDQLEAAASIEASAKAPPVAVGGWSLLPALGLLATVMGGLGWKLMNPQDKGGSRKKKSKTK